MSPTPPADPAKRRDAIMLAVPEVLDVRGLRCPIPLIRARRALRTLAPGEPLLVLATDPEAPIDLAALAADEGRPFAQVREEGVWRLTLGARAPARGSPRR